MDFVILQKPIFCLLLKYKKIYIYKNRNYHNFIECFLPESKADCVM